MSQTLSLIRLSTNKNFTSFMENLFTGSSFRVCYSLISLLKAVFTAFQEFSFSRIVGLASCRQQHFHNVAKGEHWAILPFRKLL
jgi:hypothetical protein